MPRMARLGAMLMLLVTGAAALGFGVCAVGGVVGSIMSTDIASLALPLSLFGALSAYGFYKLARHFGRVLWGPRDGDGLE